MDVAKFDDSCLSPVNRIDSCTNFKKCSKLNSNLLLKDLTYQKVKTSKRFIHISHNSKDSFFSFMNFSWILIFQLMSNNQRVRTKFIWKIEKLWYILILSMFKSANIHYLIFSSYPNEEIGLILHSNQHSVHGTLALNVLPLVWFEFW